MMTVSDHARLPVHIHEPAHLRILEYTHAISAVGHYAISSVGLVIQT
jgi:hypothetical protein